MYTELKLNIKSTENKQPHEFVAKMSNDDIDLDTLFYMFKGLVISSGFQVESFNDCIKYQAALLEKK